MHVDGGVRLTRIQRAFGPVTALEDLSLSVAADEVVAVVGPSGCGKSTLLEIVCGLQQPDAGTCESAPAVLMPQRDSLLPWLSALDNAALARRIAGDGREAARARARPLFDHFGLGGTKSLASGEKASPTMDPGKASVLVSGGSARLQTSTLPITGVPAASQAPSGETA